MSALWRLLTSVKTCVWLALLFCLSGASGSLAIGWFPGLFADMDAQRFAGWFARKGFLLPAATLWLYGLLAATALLGVNAACCATDRLLQIFRGKIALRRLLPHVMHLAFLGVVLAHLVSALSMDRITGMMVVQGGVAPMGKTGWALRLDRLDAAFGPQWPPRDANATVTVYRDRTPVAHGVVRTNRPLFHGGYGIYIKNFGSTPDGPSFAVFDATRDPGAPAVLAAALLFTAANLLHLIPSGRDDA
ncbi:MAG: cytochrome c biogenesis protein ResB [Verrucomicrobiota bacterium]